MPLEAGASREAFSNNVAEMIKAGHPRAHALAAAYRKAGEDCAEDMSPEDWQAMLSGLLEFFGEEAKEPEHKTQASDMARDGDRFAFDLGEEQNRTKDQDGHLTVKVSNFSKANVCAYTGAEVMGANPGLDLDPDRLYYLYRDPTELKKAAPTADKKPILSEHRAATADSFPAEIVIGTTGEKTRFNDPYLQGSLTFWSGKGIDAVESGKKAELSCGYRYEADMRPGKTPDGVPYDGVMRNLAFNHISIVEDGRAGADCFVGDSSEGVKHLIINAGKLSPVGSAARGVIVTTLYPVMAADSALDLKALLGPSRQKTWAADKARIVAGLPALIKGKGPKLATDAEVGPIVKQVEKLLDTINPAEEGMDDEPDDAAMDEWGEDDEKALEELQAKKAKAGDKSAKDGDPEKKPEAEDEEETAEEKAERMKKRQEAKDKAKDEELKAAGPDRKPGGKDGKGAVDKGAMDAAIKLAVDTATEQTRKATVALMNDIAEARDHAGKLVGKIVIACDSAEAVYAHALKSKGIPTAGLNLAAMRIIVDREIAHAAKSARPAFEGANDSARLTERQEAEARLGIKTKRAVRV